MKIKIIILTIFALIFLLVALLLYFEGYVPNARRWPTQCTIKAAPYIFTTDCSYECNCVPITSCSTSNGQSSCSTYNSCSVCYYTCYDVNALVEYMVAKVTYNNEIKLITGTSYNKATDVMNSRKINDKFICYYDNKYPNNVYISRDKPLNYLIASIVFFCAFGILALIMMCMLLCKYCCN